MTGSDLILKGWKISSEFKKKMYVKWCIHGISNQHPIYLYLIFVNKWEFSFSRILLWVLIKRFSYTTKFESYKYFFFQEK